MKNLAGTLPALLLVGCTTLSGTLTATSYRPTPIGSAYTVMGSDATTVADSRIRDLIRAQMQSLGFSEAASAKEADLALLYRYSVGAGETIISSNLDFVARECGCVTLFAETPRAKYPRYLYVSIADLPATRSNQKLVKIWEAWIYSEGSSENMEQLAGSFVPELFKHLDKSTSERFSIRDPSAD